MSMAVVWTVGRSRGAWWKPRRAAVSTRGQDICWHGLLGPSQSRRGEERKRRPHVCSAVLLLFVSDFTSNVILLRDKTQCYLTRLLIWMSFVCVEQNTSSNIWQVEKFKWFGISNKRTRQLCSAKNKVLMTWSMCDMTLAAQVETQNVQFLGWCLIIFK